MIKLNIKHTSITTSCLETLIEGNVNSVFVEFTFSPEWDNLSRIAVFSNGTSKISVVLSENTCVIPWEMFSCPGNLLIAVRGVGDGGNLVICTENASLGKVIESLADDDGDTPGDATPSVIDALVADVAELKSGSLNGEDGYTPVKGVDYFTADDKAEIIEEAEQEMSNTFASKDDLASKADKTVLALTDKKLKYLAELAKGQAWDIEQGTSPAYQQAVPSGAKAVAINMIGGHTEVVDGAFISADVEIVESLGFNIWDEEWEVGGIVWSTGQNANTETDRIRSKNYIPVQPNTQYYFQCSHSKFVWCYDANKTIIANVQGNDNYIQIQPLGHVFTVPDNCSYIRFIIWTSYGTTYNHDICINLSGSQNGMYKLYKHSAYPIPQALRTAHPLHSAGSVYDEYNIERKKFVQRVGVREYQSGDESDITVITDMATTYCVLLTPVEEDICEYFSDDNLLDVEAGGTLTFSQNNAISSNLEVPNDTEYAVQLEEAVL